MKLKNVQVQKLTKDVLEKSLDNASRVNLYFDYVNSKDLESLQLKILEKMKCGYCGWCCDSCNCMLLEDDIIALCKHLKCTFDEFYEKYMDKDTVLNYLKLPCPFLESTGEVRNGINVTRCIVYEARPKICKHFPFTANLLTVDPCIIGKDIVDMLQREYGIKKVVNKEDEKILTKKEKDEHRKNEEQAQKKSSIYDALEVFFPQFNSTQGHLIAVMNRPFLEKTIKVLNKISKGEKI